MKPLSLARARSSRCSYSCLFSPVVHVRPGQKVSVAAWITAAHIAALVLATTAMASPSFAAGPQQPRQCLVLGDSLAQGVSIYAPQCEARTRVGINSQAFANLYPQAGVAWSALISLGANDLPGSCPLGRTRPELQSAWWPGRSAISASTPVRPSQATDCISRVRDTGPLPCSRG